MKEPKVSVIIPVYNGERTLRQCLNSVLNQTYKNYEIIVVDNNSTDNTKEIIKESQNKSGNVKYSFEKNKSVAAARNSGVRDAIGEILAFIDSDCTAPKNWIEKLTEPIRYEDENVVTGFQKELISNYWTKNIQEADLKFNKKNLIKGNYINGLDGKNFAIKSSLMKRLLFDPNICMLDDYDLYMRLKKVPKIRFIDSIRVGHHHKNSFKKVVKTNFIRGFWTTKIYKKYNKGKEIKKDPMFESISIKSFLLFPPFIISKFIKKPIGEAYFTLVSEASWRAGIIWAIIKNEK